MRSRCTHSYILLIEPKPVLDRVLVAGWRCWSWLRSITNGAHSRGCLLWGVMDPHCPHCRMSSTWRACAGQGAGGRLALLVMAENITNGAYTGNERAFLLANILFCMGGAAAVLLTR